MKNLKLKVIGFFPILLLVSCHAHERIPLSRDIADAPYIVSKTILDNAYISLETRNKHYYAGFTIESDGFNSPTLIEVNKVGGEQKSWKFDDIISDLFVFDSHIAVASDSGVSLSLIDGTWKRNSLALSENPHIVFSDGGKRLIACSPSSLLKEDVRAGGCESYNPNWKVAFPWHHVKPKVCGAFLYAVTWPQKQNQLLAIDLDSGEIVHQQVYAGGDICGRPPVRSSSDLL